MKNIFLHLIKNMVELYKDLQFRLFVLVFENYLYLKKINIKNLNYNIKKDLLLSSVYYSTKMKINLAEAANKIINDDIQIEKENII